MGVPVAISTVGSMATANNNTGLATSIALTPATVGNIMVLVIEEKYSSGSNLQVAPGGISGGGVTTWRSAFQRFMVDGVHGVDVWWGVVTSTGSLTATVTYNSTTGQAAGSIDGWELTSTAGANTTWRVDQTGFTDPNTNATTFNYPTLTSALDKEAYIGYLAIASSASAGSGSGWIYTTDLRSNWVASNPNVGVAGTAATTSQTSGTSQVWFTVGVLFQALATWAFVQAIAPAATTGTGTTHSVTFSSNVAAPNRIILKVELNESNAPAGTLVSVSNSGTATLGTWVKASEADGSASGFSLRGETWTAVVLAGGSCTVTVSGLTGTDTWQFAVAAAEYAGLSTANDSSCVDVSNTTTWGTTSTVTSPATTAANELATGGYYDDGQSKTITAGSGFTQRGFTGSSGTCEAAIEDKDSGVSGSTTAVTFTGGATAGAATDVVIFRLAPAAPPGQRPGQPVQAVRRAAIY